MEDGDDLQSAWLGDDLLSSSFAVSDAAVQCRSSSSSSSSSSSEFSEHHSHCPPDFPRPPPNPPSIPTSSSSGDAAVVSRPQFLCVCCGQTKYIQKGNRRFIGSGAVEVAACLHKGFVASLPLDRPLPACEGCYSVSRKSTMLFRWCFPFLNGFLDECNPRKKKKVQTSYVSPSSSSPTSSTDFLVIAT